jgi:hypothetical protein
MTLRPRIPRKQEKGQPEGSAVTGKTRKPRGADKQALIRAKDVEAEKAT